LTLNGCAIVPPFVPSSSPSSHFRRCSVAIKLIVVAAVLTVSSVVGLAQSKPSIQDVWRAAEVTVTNPNPGGFPKGTHTNVQPGLFIFTAKHYSIVTDTAAKPRPTVPFKVPEKPTAEELQAAWGPLQANSGTYEVTGTTLTLRPIVAKAPAFQSGGHARYTIKLDGNNLWLMAVEVSTIPTLANAPTLKYTRVE
jgi:hypothetical protein